MILRHDAELALSCALSQGGDFAEIYLEDCLNNTVVMLDGSIESATTLRTHGAGIRVYDGLKSIYVHTSLTTLPGLLSVAKQAADAIGGIKRLDNIALNGEGHEVFNAHPFKIKPTSVYSKQKAEILRQANAAARGYDTSVKQVRVTLSDSEKFVWICNSEGLFVGDRRLYTRLGVASIACGDGENQTGFEAPGALSGYELFEERVDPAACGKEASRVAVNALRAEMCPAGEMPVVIDNGFGGVIFHEACGHSLEATSVALGNSEFCGKLGQKIASDVVTAIDDGTLKNTWGSTNIDDEGVKTGRLVLIERGVLKHYIVDRLNGRRMQMEPTGSARRQSYAFAPTSRMRNTFIAPGETSDAEILSTMGDGLYCKKMGGGSVNPVTGEFNFAVSEGYLVRDGKITKPVRGATLIGRGGEVLRRIDRVGRNLALAEGMCGSSSGSVPVCVGQPMIRVSQMTVGGRS